MRSELKMSTLTATEEASRDGVRIHFPYFLHEKSVRAYDWCLCPQHHAVITYNILTVISILISSHQHPCLPSGLLESFVLSQFCATRARHVSGCGWIEASILLYKKLRIANKGWSYGLAFVTKWHRPSLSWSAGGENCVMGNFIVFYSC